jgi:hypothetical protein
VQMPPRGSSNPNFLKAVAGSFGYDEENEGTGIAMPLPGLSDDVVTLQPHRRRSHVPSLRRKAAGRPGGPGDELVLTASPPPSKGKGPSPPNSCLPPIQSSLRPWNFRDRGVDREELDSNDEETEEGSAGCVISVMFYPPAPSMLAPRPPNFNSPSFPRRCVSDPPPSRPGLHCRHSRSVPSALLGV